MTRKSTALAGAATVIALVFALGTGVVGAAPGGTNTAAKACQGTGYQDWVRGDGTSFATRRDCTDYAKNGGTLKQKTWEYACQPGLDHAFFSPEPGIWHCTLARDPMTPEVLQALADELLPFCPTGYQRTWMPEPTIIGEVNCYYDTPL